MEEQEANGRNLGDLGLYPIYFVLGDRDQALAWLEKAHKDKSESFLYVRCWPEFDGMRADAQFARLVRGVGIPPQ